MSQCLLLHLLPTQATVSFASSWWNSVFGGSTNGQELDFDLSSAPELASNEELFPDIYKQSMHWGTYRPGVYFGVKGRHHGSLLMGLAWGSLDGKVLRHECQSGELHSFNWLEHDGDSYALQGIQDGKLGVQFRTTFVKDAAFPAHSWQTRVEASPFQEEPAKERIVSTFVYLGVEAGVEGGFQVEPAGEASWVASADKRFWTGSVRVRGRDPVKGAFTAGLILRANASGSDPEKPPPRWHYFSQRVDHETEPTRAEAPLTGVWNAKKLLEKHLRKVGGAGEPGKKSPKQALLPDKDLHDSPNFWALQVLSRPSNGLRIELHVDFERDGSFVASDSSEASAKLDESVQAASSKFNARLKEIFKAADQDASQQHVAGAAVSGVLGGLGDFRGRLLAKTAAGEDEELERLPPAVLFSCVPSRSFFPRGFLWDEGFHGLIVARWQPRIFLDILAHWLELQQPSGWIPREVPLGAEQEIRVPRQFLPQDPVVANPPSLLLPLAWLVGIAARSKSQMEHANVDVTALARRAGLASADEFRKLVLSFGASALPRLAAWFAFLDKTQRSTNLAGCYKWAGRTAAHCLASGLDDYPRGLLVNDDECHLDLHSWMMLFSKTLSSLCHQLSQTGALGADRASAVCQAPDWAARAMNLNATLHQVFVDPAGKAESPLADFMGKQPAKGKKVMVSPPWRTDGRCGPQFPMDGAPGDCDPYGGGPCCSPSGWCGGSPDFCECPGCRRAKKLEERTKGAGSKTLIAHSPHMGYVSLFPFALGHLPCGHPRAQPLLKALQPPGSGGARKAGELWSPYGVMSLSSKDQLFRQGEDYWRGKIWANLNYLTLSALHRCAADDDVNVRELARQAYDSLRKGFIETVVSVHAKQRFFFENFDPKTGEGTGVGPFTGWTTLIALVIADLPLSFDFELPPPGASDGKEL
eukprot:TRINITY_DN32526_c0_g1_i1.p1 TRINITY_DN32526_c0_g1~~TRINITY_DN32526_c0_g1_i1.p1  ORF type:complete len:927 (+),score=149.22 TRINITY_DN32526_c0_g1_i1:154-2934(+)